MNVIISNENKDIFSNLNVDVLKSMNGEFESEEIVQTFSNFFFNRMFLDITSIKNYTDIKNIQKLCLGLDVSKIILLLNDNQIVNSNIYKSKLVGLGLYNFTTDLTGLKYLYDHPNSYKDVANYQQVGDTTNIETQVVNVGLRVLGFKNVTEHAGATSLIYMLKQELSKRYSVKCIEVNKKDFFYFNDKNMTSVVANQLGNEILKCKDADIVLVDLNDMDESTLSGDVIYLVEPSTIKLNKLILLNKNALKKIANKDVVLNISLINEQDVKDFETETGVKVLYNLTAMSDKIDNQEVLLPFLEKLGFVKRNSDGGGTKKGLFGFLKKNNI